MAIHREKLSVTASTAGAGTATGPAIIGKIYGIKLLLGSSTSIDITVSTVNADGLANQLVKTSATASKMYYPRTLEHLDTSGADLTTHCQPLIAGTIRLTVANAGDSKTASVIIYYED